MDSQDKKLDQLLGDVPIPADLKTRLLQIPQQTEIETPPPISDEPVETRKSNRHATTKTWLTWILAASIVGAAAFYFVPTAKIENAKHNPKENSSVQNPATPKLAEQTNKPKTNQPLESDLLAEFNNSRELVELVRLTIENELLRQKIAALKNTTPLKNPTTQTAFSNRQTESIIASLASQSKWEWGGDEVQLRSELESVIEKYPETKGAEFANSLLNKSKL